MKYPNNTTNYSIMYISRILPQTSYYPQLTYKEKIIMILQ